MIGAAILWSYAPLLSDMAAKWTHDPQYSHGYLVPLFSLYLLWRSRSEAQVGPWTPSWWGLPLVLAGIGLRLAGNLLYFDWIELISLIPLLAGAVWLVAGRDALRWSWKAILFLAFMIPLPYRIETGLSAPLQSLATQASTYILQTLGLPAYAEGNVIIVNDSRIGVVQACNGLGMLMLFFAMAFAVALVAHRPIWQRLLIVLSAIPIAIGVNVFRISLTAFLHEFVSGELANRVFHDFAGWLMMPLALLALWLELKFLDRLTIVESVDEGPLAMDLSDDMPLAVPGARR